MTNEVGIGSGPLNAPLDVTAYLPWWELVKSFIVTADYDDHRQPVYRSRFYVISLLFL